MFPTSTASMESADLLLLAQAMPACTSAEDWSARNNEDERDDRKTITSD